MPENDKLIRLGARFATPRLSEQAAVHLALANEDTKALEDAGWKPARTAALDADVRTLHALYADQAVAKTDLPRSTAAVSAIVADAKTLKRTLVAYATNAFEDAPEILDAFYAGARVSRSTPRLVAYLRNKAPLAERHVEALTAEGAPADLAARMRAMADALEEADARQELTVDALPAKTAALYAAKGRVYEHLKKLNRIGRVAHDGDAARASRYNLDVLNRRGTRRETAPPETDGQ